MNQQKIFVFAMGLAMCCGVLLGPAPIGHAATSTKTTTSFSYSSKVVGNTVVISGNSTISSSSSSAGKTTVSKTPAVVKPPASSKTIVTTKTPASQKQPAVKTPAKKPAVAPSLKTANSVQSQKKSSSKPRVLMGSVATTVVNYFIHTKKPTTPTVFKLAPKPTPKAITKVIIKTTPKVITPAKKITVKMPAVSSSRVNSASGEASFTPETITAAAFPPAVSVSDPVYLSAPASAHYRIGTILGKTAQVRFTPIDSTWSFGDGTTGAGLNPMHTFATPGKFNATVAVRYQVSYRFAGETTWNNESGQITLTDQVQITVSVPQNEAPQQGPPVDSRPYLVGENCLKNPLAFAC